MYENIIVGVSVTVIVVSDTGRRIRPNEYIHEIQNNKKLPRFQFIFVRQNRRVWTMLFVCLFFFLNILKNDTVIIVLTTRYCIHRQVYTRKQF